MRACVIPFIIIIHENVDDKYELCERSCEHEALLDDMHNLLNETMQRQVRTVKCYQ